MKVGAKVMRGADWKWGEQDGGTLGIGRVIGELGEDGWVRVQWETGSTNSYRFYSFSWPKVFFFFSFWFSVLVTCACEPFMSNQG